MLREYYTPFEQLYSMLTLVFAEGTLKLHLVTFIFYYRLLSNSLVALGLNPSLTITVCESNFTQFVLILILQLTDDFSG